MDIATDLPASAPMMNSRNLLQPCVAVDVFLPKNLINFPVLLKVLKDLLAFRPALRYLYRHAADIHSKYERATGRTASSFNPGHDPEPLPRDLDAFKVRLREIKKRIYGYSIFEVDGAFDRVHKSSIIMAGRKQRHRVAKPNVADDYFAQNSPNFARELAAHLPRLRVSHPISSLHPHPSHVGDQERRVFVHGDDRFDVERTETEFVSQRCLTILEERVLMVRFMAMPTESERQDWNARDFSVWTPNLNTAVDRVLWDTLIMVGCFMARRLGQESKIEDEIWVTYDVRALWIWKKGKPVLATDEGLQ